MYKTTKRKPTRIIYTISYIYHNTAIIFIHFKLKIQEISAVVNKKKR